ncbi:hypothetical protein [Nocardia salmonicida]|uniref:hypothetical protein n=1 Tax=Nocardia salmonicida TaxID=53431 RepID=UPI00363981EF
MTALLLVLWLLVAIVGSILLAIVTAFVYALTQLMRQVSAEDQRRAQLDELGID